MSTVFSLRQESMEVVGENQTVDLNLKKKKKCWAPDMPKSKAQASQIQLHRRVHGARGPD